MSLIIANWKMNFTLKNAIDFCQKIIKDRMLITDNLLIAAPTLYLTYLSHAFPAITFCAQDVSSIENYGSYTGECSANMLFNSDIKYAIIGHSERRLNFKESNELIQKKSYNCIKAGIVPIICIGENIDIRNKNQHKEFIKKQCIESIGYNNMSKIIIAYEPVWSIGTGDLPKVEYIAEIFDLIDSLKNCGDIKCNISLVYGGSVNASNISSILRIDKISGILLGKASIDYEQFTQIINFNNSLC
ncbi:MAG: triose-phosphate isomerase [Rickettsiaceae bacterium]